MPTSDRELVRRARDGDRGAFHELVDRHARFMYGLAVKLLGNATDAEDVVQEALIGAFRGLAGFREEASPKTWLAQILVRQAARHYRSQHRHRAASLDRHEGGDPSAASFEPRKDVELDVAKAIMDLAPEHREVIVLREFEGLAYEQIAEVLSLPRGTVESRLFRARRALAELLKEYLE